MSDIEYTDGSTADFDKLPGETLIQFFERTAAQNDAEYEEFRQRLAQMGWGIG